MKILLSALLATVAALPAHADTVTFTLSQATQTARPGTTLVYSGTITAAQGNRAPIFLNGDFFEFAGSYKLDDSPFLNNFPVSLNSGQSDTDVLFNIAIPLNASAASFAGTFFLYGGADSSALDLLGRGNFAATVTPEPSAWLLCGTGLLAIFSAAYRRNSDQIEGCPGV